MPRRKPFTKDSYRHIYNRGLCKRNLFFSENDFNVFISIMKKLQKKYKGIDIIEFCILPNHFHFVIHNKRYGFDISRFIGKLCTSYSMYLFSTYGKSRGMRIFEGNFKAKLLDNEDYLNQCKFYVKHNAIKHGFVKDMMFRKYSSYKLGESINQRKLNQRIINHFSQDTNLDLEYEWENEIEDIIEN